MLANLTTLILATLALITAAQQTCVSKTKYTLTMSLGNVNNTAALHALDNGPADTIILVAAPQSSVPGTPIYELDASPHANLNAEFAPAPPLSNQTGAFHLSVPDMGARYGAAATVLGSKDFTWPHWSTSEEMVWPMMTSAAQLFFACDVTIEGREYSALSWGLLASNGSMPPGCRVTVVKKRYDVQVRC